MNSKALKFYYATKLRIKRFFQNSEKKLPKNEERNGKFVEMLHWAKTSKKLTTSDVFNKLARTLYEYGFHIADVKPNFWMHLTRLIQENKLTLDADNQLRNLIEAEFYDHKNTKELLVIYQLLILMGLFQSAFAIRKSARSGAIKNGQMDIMVEPHAALAAALELRDFELANKVSRHLSKFSKNISSGINLPTTAIELLTPPSNSQIANIKFEEHYDQQYKEFLCSRSVAILGAAPDNKETLDEITNFDIVIRTNYVPQLNISHKKENQKQVSYFANDYLDRLIQNNAIQALGKLDYCIFRSNRWISATRAINKRSRVIHRFPWRFNGIPNAVPDLAYDTSLFGPSRLKIFNTTLMLNTDGNLYHQNYPIQNQSTLNSFGWHDPLTQFSLLKNLYLSNRIEVDSRLKAILQLSEYEFISKLQKQLIAWATD